MIIVSIRIVRVLIVLKNKIRKSDLLNLINIGPKSVQLLNRSNIKSVKDLKKIGAEEAYRKICSRENKKIHPAFLYVMRAALWYEKNQDKREVAKMWWMFRRPNKGNFKK